MRIRRRVGSLAHVGATAFACLGLAVAGCGGGENGGGGGSTTASGPKPTLTMANNLACTNLEPGLGTPGGRDMLMPYEPLILYTTGRRLAPGLATSWEVAPGNRAITLTLRDNARFSDGEPVDAAAVKTWFAYRSSIISPLDSILGRVASVDVIDRHTVRVSLEEPNPTIAQALSQALGSNWGFVTSPKAIARARANPRSNWLKTHSDGAGQYMLDPAQSVPGDHCTYVPNPNYYDQSKIKWGKIVTRNVVDANSMLAAMKTGQIDVGEGDSSTVDAARAAGLDVIHSPGRLQGIYFFDHTGRLAPALADVRVRQALNYAIDRKKIAEALFGPDAQPTANPDPNSDAVDPSFDGFYPYNPAKARALLAEAGYPKGFSFRIEAPGPWIGAFKSTQLAQAVAKYLADVGVKMEITSTPSQGAWQEALASRSYAGGSVIWGSNPAWSWYGLALVPGGPLADQHGWQDAASRRLWEQGRVAPPAQAEQIWRELIRRSIDQAFFLPVLSPGFYTYVSRRVGGVTTVNEGGLGPSDGMAPAQ